MEVCLWISSWIESSASSVTGEFADRQAEQLARIGLNGKEFPSSHSAFKPSPLVVVGMALESLWMESRIEQGQGRDAWRKMQALADNPRATAQDPNRDPISTLPQPERRDVESGLPDCRADSEQGFCRTTRRPFRVDPYANGTDQDPSEL